MFEIKHNSRIKNFKNLFKMQNKKLPRLEKKKRERERNWWEQLLLNINFDSDN